MAQEGQLRVDDAAGRTEPFDRLALALDRIAAAAGRREEALRVAELNARAAQHENAMLREAEAAVRQPSPEEVEARRRAEATLGERENELRVVAARLDALIAAVGGVLGDAEPG